MTDQLQNAQGAAIAAIWTPKRVVLAARAIHSAGDVFFALTGLSACKDMAFDAAALIEQALTQQTSFQKKLAAVSEALEEPLQQAAQFIHDKQPDHFKKHLAGQNALEIIFGNQRGDETLLSQLAFKTKKRGKEVVFQALQKDYPNTNTNIMSVEIVVAGVETAVGDAFRKGVTGQQALVYPEQTLQKFVDLAAVGYPCETVKLAAGTVTRTKLDAP